MFRVNRDTLVAIVLLLLCGGAFAHTFSIPHTTYNSMGAAVWPRFIIIVIAVLSLIYLAEALRDKESPRIGTQGGVRSFIKRYWNAFQCYLLFGFFVASLPFLGILLSGFFYVFGTLAVIGQRTLKANVIHLIVTVAIVLGFWAIFTFGLGVTLPEGVFF